MGFHHTAADAVAFTTVARVLQHFKPYDRLESRHDLAHERGGIVGGAVVDYQYLRIHFLRVQEMTDLLQRRKNTPFFVEGGDNDRKPGRRHTLLFEKTGRYK